MRDGIGAVPDGLGPQEDREVLHEEAGVEEGAFDWELALGDKDISVAALGRVVDRGIEMSEENG